MLTRRRSFAATALALLLAGALFGVACGGDDSSTKPGTTTTGSSATKATGTDSGKFSVQGSVVSTGDLEGTWTWKEGNALTGAHDLTLSAPDGRMGYISVKPDGSVSFGSGAAPKGPYGGKSGGKFTANSDGVVCSMTVDADLAGSSDTKVHVKGAITIKGTFTNELGFQRKC